MGWKSDIVEWGKVPTEFYQYIKGEADKHFAEVFAVSEKITQRVYALLTLLLPTIAGTIGLIANDSEKSLAMNYLGLFISVIGIYIIIRLMFIIKTWVMYYPGSEPQQFLTETHANPKGFADEEKLKAMMVTDLEELQDRIDFNSQVNERRIRALQHCIYISVATLAISLGVVVYCKLIPKINAERVPEVSQSKA